MAGVAAGEKAKAEAEEKAVKEKAKAEAEAAKAAAEDHSLDMTWNIAEFLPPSLREHFDVLAPKFVASRKLALEVNEKTKAGGLLFMSWLV